MISYYHHHFFLSLLFLVSFGLFGLLRKARAVCVGWQREGFGEQLLTFDLFRVAE